MAAAKNGPANFGKMDPLILENSHIQVVSIQQLGILHRRTLGLGLQGYYTAIAENQIEQTTWTITWNPRSHRG